MVSVYLIHKLSNMPYMLPSNIPKRVAELGKQAWPKRSVYQIS